MLDQDKHSVFIRFSGLKELARTLDGAENSSSMVRK
jgi:hypothetical protein